MEEAKRLIFQLGVKAVNNVHANMIFFLLRIDHLMQPTAMIFRQLM